MAVPIFAEDQHPFDGLLSELHQLSVDEVIIAQNQNINVGQVLGAIGVTANMTVSAAVAGANNVGTSTFGTITPSTVAQNGVYQVTVLTTLATSAFTVTRPDGTIDGTGKIGSAYTGQISFTLTAGGTPTDGDTYAITVTRPFDEAGEQYEAWGPGATDGSQVAVAIALQPVTTGAGMTQKIAALRRDGAYRAVAAAFGATSFTASQSTTTLTVTALPGYASQIVLGSTVTSTGTSETITAFGTGTGGIGTYTVSQSQTLTSQNMTAACTAAQIAFATEQLAAQRIVLR